MTERAGESIQATGWAIKRRGILTAAAAVVAGIMAKQTAQPVAASTPMLIANTETAGILNTVVGHSGLIGTGSSTDAVLVGDSGTGSAQAGVLGTTLAEYRPTEFCAVYGRSNDAHSVFGNASNGIGVKGSSGGTMGVQGLVPSTSGAANTVGVQGLNQSTGAGGIGVLGLADIASGIGAIGKSSAGVGVKGVSDTGFPIIGQAVALGSANPGALGIGTAGPGVQGQSTAGHGLIGYTTATDGHAALIGFAQAAGGVGLIGVAPGSVGHWAGVFYGDVHFAGATSAQMAGTAALHPDGTRRLLQGVAAPEGWFEDFGAGTLANGQAEVKLDPEFAALVDAGTLHVFAMPEGPLHLHVSQKGATGFTVVGTPLTSVAGGSKAPTQAPSGAFSWRAVAKRKEGGAGRLAKVAAPPALKGVARIAVPETPALPPPPPPKTPEPRERADSAPLA
jgi:hypothetical protein